jgi:hypothetical protein
MHTPLNWWLPAAPLTSSGCHLFTLRLRSRSRRSPLMMRRLTLRHHFRHQTPKMLTWTWWHWKQSQMRWVGGAAGCGVVDRDAEGTCLIWLRGSTSFIGTQGSVSSVRGGPTATAQQQFAVPRHVCPLSRAICPGGGFGRATQQHCVPTQYALCMRLCALQESRMQKAVDVVASNFNTMRTGRANPAILDRIMVRLTDTAGHQHMRHPGASCSGPSPGTSSACG